MGGLTRKVLFEAGHNCIDFECRWGQRNCQPETGDSHGVGSLGIRWLVTGDKGAVQFLLYTGWLPIKISDGDYRRRFPFGDSEPIHPFPADPDPLLVPALPGQRLTQPVIENRQLLWILAHLTSQFDGLTEVHLSF